MPPRRATQAVRAAAEPVHKAPASQRSKSKTASTKRAAPSFAVDWFSEHAASWARHLGPLKGKPGLQALVVGPHEGRVPDWLLRNVLTHADSRVSCVEDFGRYATCAQYKGKGVTLGAAALRAAFERNVLTTFGDKARVVEGDMHVTLVRLVDAAANQKGGSGTYDIVVVDHTTAAADTLETLVLAHRLLKPGGRMVITNYTHSKEHDGSCPRPGIDAYLTVYAPYLRTLHAGWHVFVQRRERALALQPCQSEYFDPHPEPGRCGESVATGSTARAGSKSVRAPVM